MQGNPGKFVDKKEIDVVLQHFGLKEQPFGVTPGPKYLYPTPRTGKPLPPCLTG